MSIFHICVLALIQGFTEFLPISSSAHLILPSQVLGWPDQGLAFDVAVHGGTLLAVIGYFRHDVGRLLMTWFGSCRGKHCQDSRLAWTIVLATIPAGIVGLLFGDMIENYARSCAVIATTTLLFAPLLWWADKHGKERLNEFDITWLMAFLIGCAQALALIPGTSRSGITITAALLLGLTRVAAARYSFLMSIPVIVLAGGMKVIELVTGAEPVNWSELSLGIVLSFVSAYLCIHLFLKVIERMGMTPFVIYRLLLGFALVGFCFTL